MYKSGKLKSSLIVCAVFISLVGIFYAPLLTGSGFLWEDLLFYSYPSANYLAAAFHEWRFPLWISGMQNGVPFYTNLNLTAFYPPLWVLAIVSPGGQVTVLQYQFYLVIHYVVAGIFIWLLLREHRIHPVASLTGMVVFVFSGFFSLHVIHANVITAFLWLPLQCLFAKRIVDCPCRWGNYAGFIVATLISFFAGFPQVIMYDSYFVLAYWVFIYIQKEIAVPGWSMGRLSPGIIRQFLLAALLFLLAAMLGAAQFVPVAENWSLSYRQELGFDVIADMSMPWSRLILGVVPDFFGASNGDGSGVPFWGFNRDTIEFGKWNAGYWMYWDFGFYAGQIALIAMAVALFNFRKFFREKREFLFFMTAIPVVLLLMTGRYGKLYDLFYYIAPGFSMFRSPPRVGCLFELCAAVLAAGLMDMLLKGKEELNLKRPCFMLGAGYCALFLWVLILGSTVFPELKDERLMKHALGQTSQCFAFFLGAALLLMWLRTRTKIRKQTDLNTWFSSSNWKVLLLSAGVALLAFSDLYLAFHRVQSGKTDPADYYADKNGLISQMQKLRQQQGPFRFAQLRDGKINEEVVFPRNMGYMHPGYEALEGYILFNLKGFTVFHTITNQRALLDIQNVGVIANSDSRTRQVSLSQYTNSLPRAKFYHDIRAYSDAKALCTDLDSGRLDYRSTLGILEDECAKYRISTSTPPLQASAQIHFTPVSSDEYRISYQTTAPGVIFVSESYYPGWQADGGRYPVIHAFGPFKGIVIREAGSGVITVKFSPRTLWLGLTISGVTLGLLLATLVVFVRRARRCGTSNRDSQINVDVVVKNRHSAE